MFLGVSGSIYGMDMSEEERARFAGRLLLEQQVRFDGVAQRAYQAAGVNSATWTRAITGATMKPHKRLQIIKNLFPDSLGEWTRIPDRPELNTGEMMYAMIERVREQQRREAAKAAETD